MHLGMHNQEATVEKDGHTCARKAIAHASGTTQHTPGDTQVARAAAGGTRCSRWHKLSLQPGTLQVAETNPGSDPSYPLHTLHNALTLTMQTNANQNICRTRRCRQPRWGCRHTSACCCCIGQAVVSCSTSSHRGLRKQSRRPPHTYKPLTASTQPKTPLSHTRFHQQRRAHPMLPQQQSRTAPPLLIP